MIAVYRIENRLGDGVFSVGASSRATDTIIYGSNIKSPYIHPSPTEEGLNFNFYQRCAFENVKQYLVWFPTETMRNALASKDCPTYKRVKIVKYLADEKHVIFGEYQCMFDKRFATKVAEYECNEIEGFQ